MKQTSKSLIDWGRKIDLSGKEDSRTYRFPGGEYVKIDLPQFLIVSDNGHRVLDGSGISHYIPYGWIELIWVSLGDRSFLCLDEGPVKELAILPDEPR